METQTFNVQTIGHQQPLILSFNFMESWIRDNQEIHENKTLIHTILMIPMAEVGIKLLVTSPFLLGIMLIVPFGINLNV